MAILANITMVVRFISSAKISQKINRTLSERNPTGLQINLLHSMNLRILLQACYLLGESPNQKQQEKVENPLFSIIVPIYNV